MRALIAIALGACVLAGCGDSIGERLANSPEVKERLIENEKRRQAELEYHKKQLEEIQNSTEAALRAAKELQEAPPSLDVSEPAADPEKRPSEAPGSPKVDADPLPPAPTPKLPSAAVKTQSGAPAAAASPTKWARLQAGMSKDAVETLLGPPTATSEDRTLLYWHYGTGPKSGRVAFLAGSGQLVAWESPIR